MSISRLRDKVALVTAATAGIGLGIAERLGSEGARLVICSRKQQNVDETVLYLKGKGYDVTGCACHVGDAKQRRALIRTAIDAYGRIDILVSNAAVNPMAGPILEATEDAIDKVLDVNVKAAILLTKEALACMPSGASIIFISSITAFQPPSPIGLYAVTKTALLGLTKGLAAELGPRGIRVNCIAPGIVPTKFASYLVSDPELAQAQIDTTMLGRLGRPQDMAAAAAFLASDDAAYITGETLVVAGGMQSRL
jgi:dehydrogenase/reductase SDR family member 4